MLDKLERKIGRYAIKNLIVYIIAGYVIGYLLYFTNDRFGLYDYILFSPALIMRGQVWRLFTWVLTIPSSSSLLAIIVLLFFYTIGRGLENSLGAFKYNVFIFSGWFFMTFGAMIFYWISMLFSSDGLGIGLSVSTYYINMASFLAFAVLYPDVRVLLFFIIPIRMKVLAIIDAIYLGWCVLSGMSYVMIASNDEFYKLYLAFYGQLDSGVVSRDYMLIYGLTGAFSIIISLLNFLIFFFATRKRASGYYKNAKHARESERSYNNWEKERTSPHFSDSGANKNVNNAGRNNEESNKRYNPQFKGSLLHRCEICGRTNVDFPNLQFRYCSKCSGDHEYCEDHIFTHEHIK